MTIDLGKSHKVKRISAQFEYATWFYQYLLETSMDGKQWTVFADRRENTRWGSPMIDRNDQEACFVRLTITGVEKPGIFGAVCNIRVFDEDRVDEFERLADDGFQNFIDMQSDTSAKQSYRRSFGIEPTTLIELKADDLELNEHARVIRNHGSLGGEFTALKEEPLVGTVEDRKAFQFSGKEVLKASFVSPPSLSGNSSYTIEAVVLNQEVAEAEVLISWCGRGGPDGMTGQVGYGSHPQWGAIGHWGFADMGFRNGVPTAGKWHHIAYTFDGIVERVYVDGKLNNESTKMLLMHEGRSVFLAASEPGIEHFSGAIQTLRVLDACLSAEEIQTRAMGR